ncbi:hypothetical protein A3K82_02750 [Candidatus Pacearchaeota archaeon RBG_19FT_COMBO_34_9]|nr:MAG: hypothetical protein A3K82_02750 [Candidatus Pacearchaeota archaeon RBG_19FT_COMBO_34_9]OGJ16976.1 MAG: hypothetical protein A3K74_01125 [Candidatus Pacearchaeota archaeon RBG_13_33_26]
MKRGKKKLFVILGIFIIALLVTSVLIAASDEKTDEIIKEKTEKISKEAYDYIENFIEKKGIGAESINSVTEVNFEDLPKEVSIENVNNANLAIYQIDYNKTTEQQDKVFVITYSVGKLESQGDLIISQDKREFLNFGFDGEMKESGFLETSTGVEGSLEKGYVMMRHGSIVGISTNLEVLEGNGNIEIVIYRNGEQVQFGNSFVADLAGVKKDYDVQSKDTVSFEPGDVISLYAKSSDGIALKDVITLLEIITE